MLKSLLSIAKKLRRECPWDKKQTLSKYPDRLLEESEEIREAIKKKDWPNLKEEIGDVLFNLIMMMQIAEEKGHFTADETIQACEKKIIERHTWVFGDDIASTPEEVMKLWKRNKEKGI
jgi:uncharacterized protein YabN with tetrapyrrole methylase and pyrophosphatase domain